MSHVAIYGNISIKRKYCSSCQCWALVIDGKLACCDERDESEASKLKRMSEPEDRRHGPGVATRKAILRAQGDKCFYCTRSFGSLIMMRGALRKLKCHWDHLDPFVRSMNNRSDNWVAACNFCNLWKADKIFRSIEEIQIYVSEKWKEKTTVSPGLPRVRKRIRNYEKDPGVRSAPVPIPKL